MPRAEGWSSEVHPLDAERIFRTLIEHRVVFVVVGGMAAILRGWSGSTVDADVVPAGDTANLNRLGRALRALGAVVWADPGRADLSEAGKPPEADEFGYTAEGLRHAGVWHLTSDAGLVDVAFAIEAVGGHDALEASAGSTEVFDLRVRVASLEDIIRSKRAVGRPKDLSALPALEELLRERKRGTPGRAGA